MTQFFRRIRYDLMEKNKPGKYLKYAIGEIVLVVIGILIALQLNIANEKRKAKAQLKQHFQELKFDFQNDLKEWRTKLDMTYERDREGNYLLKFLNDELKETADTTRLTLAFIQAGNIWEFEPKTIAFEDLLSVGNLQLIKNPELRLLLNDYFVWKNNLDVQRIRYGETLQDERFNYADPRILREFLLTQMEVDLVSEANFESYKVNWSKLKQSEYYKILLGRFLAVNPPRILQLNEKKKSIDRMIDLINLEIKN